MTESDLPAKPHRRRRRPQPYRRVAIGLFAGYVLCATAYVCVAAMIVASRHWHVEFREAVLPRLNDVLVFTFFLVCGCSVGSFLNVVVWRMPQGLSVDGHSFCPRCRQRLRARDNVPVFGWLWLGGRCRDCRLPISSRYPIVEAAVGICFGLVGTAELYGWNLPLHPPQFFDGLTTPLYSVDVFPILLFHLVGISIAWSMGLIRYDGNAIPSKLARFAGLWLIGGLLVFPSLALVPWQLTLPKSWPPSNWLIDLIASESSYRLWGRPGNAGGQGGFGGLSDNVNPAGGGFDSSMLLQSVVRVASAVVAAGFFARVLAKAFCPQADLKMDPLSKSTTRLLDLVYLISVPALLIGWQSLATVLLLAALLAPILRAAMGDRNRDALGWFALAMPISLSLQVAFWRWSLDFVVWPGDHASRPYLLTTGVATLLIPLWLHESVGKRDPDPESESGHVSEFDSETPSETQTGESESGRDQLN